MQHPMPVVFSRRSLIATALMALVSTSQAQAFDHQHSAWSVLLRKHVVVIEGGKTTQVRYAGFAADRASLQAYLSTLSSVNAAMFDAFTKPQQMAFLINAYNAYTVELILTRYPKLASIKDLGSLLQSPWKKEFVPLLGKTLSLDGIEHEQLRQRGRFDDPRVHFAVNCASIGCPALREEAFVAERLDAQLEEQARRFMSDRSRNRWNGAKQQLEVSKIFDWYGEDFRLGHKGIHSLAAFCARYADLLADAPADRERIRAMAAKIDFLDYDWKLNDAK
ncbi:MAG: DUF547 domain-containing protein [Rhizobacter sp.]